MTHPVRTALVPRHLTVVMNGNGRWDKQRRFSDAMWPAFERQEFERALAARRERRFGLVSEQLSGQEQPLKAAA